MTNQPQIVDIKQTVPMPSGYVEVSMYGNRIWMREEATVDLPGGLIGYYMPPEGACLASSLATMLQRPLETLPDLRTASEILAWAHEEGFESNFLNPRTDPRPNGLALAITYPLADGVIANARHVIVLKDGKRFFDPASRFLWPNGQPPPPVTAAAIEYALTLTPKEMR